MLDELNTTPMGEDDETTKVTDDMSMSEERTQTDPMSDPAILEFIQKQIAEGIQKALKGRPPKANTLPISATEKAEFERMSYKQRVQLFQSNPQTYYKLVKGGI